MPRLTLQEEQQPLAGRQAAAWGARALEGDGGGQPTKGTTYVSSLKRAGLVREGCKGN